VDETYASTLHVQSQDDVVAIRQAVRKVTIQSGFNLVDQTMVVTAASELARNTFVYGGGGTVSMEIVEQGPRKGIRLTFEDRGPGIANIEQALRDGFTTGNGLGLGLGGSKRLSSEFEISSAPGIGTRVIFIRWKP
jgi:serine/threonine-protein kinase RsbT